MSTWGDFLHWAARMAETVDPDADERDDKVAIAGRIRDACELAVRGASGWREAFGKAMSVGSLLSWQVVDDVKKTIESRPDEMRDAIVTLWHADDPVSAVNRFVAEVEAAGLTGRPGGVTSLASVVLMGRDPGLFPPYRSEFVGTWAKAVGDAAPDRSPSGQYGTLIGLCDELLRRGPAAGLRVRDRLDAQGLAWVTLQSPPPVRWSPLDQARLAALRAGDDSREAIVPRGHDETPGIEVAAWLILEPGLHGGPSPFDPGVATWTAKTATDLLAQIKTDPITDGTLWERFEAQLSGADDPTILLAAELWCLRLLPVSALKPETKIDQVARILSWSRHSRAVPDGLAAGLRANGAFDGGAGYNQQAVQHVQWFCRFVQTWTGLPETERTEALRDPSGFIEVTASVPDDVPTARYTLEFLAWPGFCPPVVSARHRQLIHQHLMPDLGEPSGTDDLSRTRDLIALRAFHGCAEPDKPDWYQEPHVSRWKGGPTTGPRAWLVRSGEGGSPLVDHWVAEGYVSLKAHMLGDLPAGTSEKDVRAAVRGGYMHLDATQQDATARAYYWFLSVMKADDLAVTLDQGMLRVGTVVGDPEYVESRDARLRREVTWGPEAIPKDDLPALLTSRLEQQGSVVDLTSAYDELNALIDLDTAAESDDGTALTVGGQHPRRADDQTRRDRPPRLPPVTEDLAGSLYMPASSLQEMVDLLQARQQMVFYGPPGTGKTFVAKELAHHLVGDPSHYRLVQFHPSYSYEDFFEGYRPTLTDAGRPTFALRDGPLKQLVSECKIPENRGQPFILIIDEMNRANLAKVFGELYFLLEYRDETVQLQYQEPGGEPFFLPRNLFIIGTMNTTDRSISLVDAAIRRRFPFYELHPGQDPVRGVLRRYLADHGLPDERARLLDGLNAAMGESGRDLHIGPSYFMRAEADGEAGLERIWRYDILPLLEEHFYGQWDREVIHERFGLESIRRQIAPAADPAAEPNRSPTVSTDETTGLAPGAESASRDAIPRDPPA